MQSDVAIINGKIDALTAEHVTINGQVNDVAARLVVVEASIEDHEERVSSLESQIRTKVEQAEYDTEINEINADIDSLINAFTWKTLS
jgi:chromosome segregation ATPase